MIVVKLRNSSLEQSVEDCTLLALPSGWLVCWQAKPNVCNVWVAKIVFKKVRWEKK